MKTLKIKQQITSRTNESVDKYLKDEQRNKVAALVTAGSFIEGLYLSTALVNNYPKDLLTKEQRNIILTPVIKVILEFVRCFFIVRTTGHVISKSPILSVLNINILLTI